MTEELKPCPFCGAEADVVWNLHGRYAVVMCRKCNSKTRQAYYGKRSNFVRGELGFESFKTDDEARARVVYLWNHRADMQEEVIRCMDCKHCEVAYYGCEELGGETYTYICKRFERVMNNGLHPEVELSNYCCWAERKQHDE